jgi:hypothetical protein
MVRRVVEFVHEFANVVRSGIDAQRAQGEPSSLSAFLRGWGLGLAWDGGGVERAERGSTELN